MGKSNNLHNQEKTVYQQENYLRHFFKKDEFEILKNINECFFNKIKINLSDFIKKNIKNISYAMKIDSITNYNKKNIKNVSFLHSIEVLPLKNQFFLTFSFNFLSIIIDLLFGGQGNLVKKYDKKNTFTLTEQLINKKVTNLIVKCFFKNFKQFFSLSIDSFNMEMFLDLETSNFNSYDIYLINNFNFYINDIEVYFNVFTPLSIIKKINKKKLILNTKQKKEYKNNQNISLEKSSINNINFKNIYDVELDIKCKINDIFIPYSKFHSLSTGDVLLIKNPDKIIGYLEDQPIFFGKYKRLNERRIVFIEKFIKNAEYKKNKEYLNE